DSIHFYPNSTSVVLYYWSFGDGSTSTATAPWHLYASSGTYYACLTIVTTAGDTCTWCDSIHVGTIPPCNAQFYHYSLSSNPDSKIGRATCRTTAIASYHWSFGDGTSSTDPDPWHFYTSSGTYYACLTIVT